MNGLRSGELAAAAGVNVQTLRYYERRGLLSRPDRSLGGHRRYPEQALTVLRIIKAAQRLGFRLDELAPLLRAQPRGRTDLPARTADKLVEVDAKLAELTEVRDTLRAMLTAGCADLVGCSENPSCPMPFTA